MSYLPSQIGRLSGGSLGPSAQRLLQMINEVPEQDASLARNVATFKLPPASSPVMSL